MESAKRFRVDAARNRLIESGILADHNDAQYIFTADYVFNTPSGAAVVILGRSSNGWTDWKNDQGQTLHDVKRAPDLVPDSTDVALPASNVAIQDALLENSAESLEVQDGQ